MMNEMISYCKWIEMNNQCRSLVFEGGGTLEPSSSNE